MGFRLKRERNKFCASELRNCGIPNFARRIWSIVSFRSFPCKRRDVANQVKVEQNSSGGDFGGDHSGGVGGGSGRRGGSSRRGGGGHGGVNKAKELTGRLLMVVTIKLKS